MKLETVCNKCMVSIKINRDMVLPVREYENDKNDSEGKLVLVYRCPFCGKVNSLTDKDKDKFSFFDLRYLLIKYAGISEDIYRTWMLTYYENIIINFMIDYPHKINNKLIKYLSLLRAELKELNSMIYLRKATYNGSKLYLDWFTEDELIDREKIERKRRRSLQKK